MKHGGCLGPDCPLYTRNREQVLNENDLNIEPEQFFTKNLRFIPKRLADAIESQQKFVSTSIRSDIYRYDPTRGIWVPDGETIIRKTAVAYLKLLSTNHRVNETVSIIRDRNYIPRDRLGGPLNKVVLLNGVYDLETRALSQFDPELYAITQLQLTLNPETKCPAIMKFLGEVLNEIDIPKVEELIGYTLYRKYPIARIFVLTGEGQNGKSTLLRLIGTFLGKENISSLTLQEISEDRFAKASLFGKLANICADIPATPIKYTGIIKILTGEDETTAQFKFKDLFGFFNFAKLIFSANEVPQTYDNTVAFFRRMILISFPNQFPADDPQTDPNILDKITTPEELSGLFNLAINGLRRLLEQGHFTNEESVESRSKSYVLASNPAQFFINSFVEMSDNTLNYIAKDELFRDTQRRPKNLGGVR